MRHPPSPRERKKDARSHPVLEEFLRDLRWLLGNGSVIVRDGTRIGEESKCKLKNHKRMAS